VSKMRVIQGRVRNHSVLSLTFSPCDSDDERFTAKYILVIREREGGGMKLFKEENKNYIK